MLELYLVRHGESIRNVACLQAHQGSGAALDEQLQGYSCEPLWPLTEKGRTQAEQAGKWLHEQIGKVDAVYCSPYLRARQTAEQLQLENAICFDRRLRERVWGDFAPGAYSPSEYMADLAECSSPAWRSRFPGAESILDLTPATAGFLEEVCERHAGGRVIAVTHGGRMQAFEHLIEGNDTPRRYPNCAILCYRFEPDATFVRVDFPAQDDVASIPWQSAWQPVRMRA